MNPDPIDRIAQQAKQAAKEIVQRAENIREGISQLVSRTAAGLAHTKDGLLSLVNVVADAAASGARDALPDKSESILRQVVDGLAEGLSKAAHATRLTLEESGSRGVHFAKEDLRQVLENFRAAGYTFGKTFHDALARVGGHTAGQAQSLVAHARQTLRSLTPVLESAVKTALDDPAGLGRESVRAGAASIRQAAGALFTELGRRLQQAEDGTPPAT